MEVTLLPVNILQIVFLFFALVGLLVCIQLPRIKSFTFILILIAFGMVFNLLEQLNITRELYLITPIFILAKGPAFYLFVKKYVYQQSLLSDNSYRHFFPMLCALPFTAWTQHVIAIGTISQVIYAVLIIRLINTYHRGAYAKHSDADAMNIQWLVNIFILLLVLEAIDLLRLNLQPFISLSLNLNGQLAINTFSLLLFTGVLIKLIQQQQVFSALSHFDQQEEPAEIDYENNEVEQAIFSQIEQLLIQQKLFQQARLSLADVAQHTGLLERDISRAINLGGHTSFCDLVNQMRVDAIKQTITQTPKGNLLDIAFANGFNSKSSFNTVFKRIVGMTPTQYSKTLSASIEQ